MHDSDEEVDLEHSQLYRLGFNDTFTRDRARPAPNTDSPTRTQWIMAIENWIKNHVNISANYSDAQYVERFLSLVLNSDVLVDDAYTFLRNVFEDFPKEVLNKSQRSRRRIWRDLFHDLTRKRLAFPLGSLLLFSISKYLPFQWNLSLETFGTRVMKPLGCVMVPVLWSWVVYDLGTCGIAFGRTAACIKTLDTTEIFLKNCSVFLHLLKKCVNFIREMEMIGHGFLLTISGATLSSLQKSKNFTGVSQHSKLCRCEQLRIVILRVVRKMIQAFGSNTLELIEKCPLDNCIDSGWHYIALMGDENFTPLVTTSFEDEDHLKIITDNLSISAIESLSQLCVYQMSEFVLRLALCFSRFRSHEQARSVQGVFVSVSTLIGGLQKELDDGAERIRQSYEFHRMRNRIRNTTSNRAPKKFNFSPDVALATAVNSLSLHLQVAFCRVDELQAELERCLGMDDHRSGDAGTNDSSSVRSFFSAMEDVGRDLKSCEGCLEESSLRLTKLFKRDGDAEAYSLARIEPTCAELEVPAPIAPMPLTGKTDIAPEDQVFEAYIDETYVAFNDDFDVNDSDGEFKKLTKEQRDVSQRLFNELKTVLIVKQEEWQQREARALAAVQKHPPVADQGPESEPTVGLITLDGGLKAGVQAVEDNKKQAENMGCTVEKTRDLVVSAPGVRWLDSRGAVGEDTSKSEHGIAAMAAARSRMWNLNLDADTFGSDGDECSSSPSSSDESHVGTN